MNNAPRYFAIRFTERVVFKDQKGTETHVFEVDDIIQASFDTGDYYVTGIGGIYHTEAVKV